MKFFGFTLIELVVVVALFAFVAMALSPTLLGTLRKNWLSSESDKVVLALKLAQQNSRAAIDGKKYGIEFFENENAYRPIPDGIKQVLQHGVQIDSISESKIEFQKLTGELLLDSEESEVNINLKLGNLQSVININSQGVVEKK